MTTRVIGHVQIPNGGFTDHKFLFFQRQHIRIMVLLSEYSFVGVLMILMWCLVIILLQKIWSGQPHT